MKRIFFKTLSATLIALLFCTPSLLSVNKLLIWATVDQQFKNKQTINELYDYLKKNNPEIFEKNIKADDTRKPHIAITTVGVITEENGKQYIADKLGKRVPLEKVIKAVEKAISRNKINSKNMLKFNLKAGSRFSDPTNKAHYYIKQIALLEKNNPLHILGHAITKELTNIGLLPSEFKPNVNSTCIYSKDKHALGQFIFLQNRGKFWKILQAVPARTGLTCSKVQILIDKGDNYTAIKSYDLK